MIVLDDLAVLMHISLRASYFFKEKKPQNIVLGALRSLTRIAIINFYLSALFKIL